MPNADARRHGRTLAELLVALLISGIFCALLANAFMGHERLVAGATAIAEARSQQRQAAHIVPSMMQGAAGGPAADLHAVHDTLIEFDYTIATGVVCLPATAARAVLAPDTIAAGQRLASFTHMPRPGDIAHIFDPGALPGTLDDRWWTAAIGGTSALPNGCAGSSLLDPVADGAHTARVVTFSSWSGGTPAVIPEGAVVQFTRRARLELYATAGKHYLGYSDFDATLGRWSVIQPVSGPYYGRGHPGVEFALLDSLGGTLPFGPLPSGVAALSVTLRTRTTPLRIAGLRAGARAESLAAFVALRNR